MDAAISWVFKPQHRTRIVFQRFRPWWNAQRRKELAEQKEREQQESDKKESAKEEKDAAKDEEKKDSMRKNNEENNSETNSDFSEKKTSQLAERIDSLEDDDNNVRKEEVNNNKTKELVVDTKNIDNTKENIESTEKKKCNLIEKIKSLQHCNDEGMEQMQTDNIKQKFTEEMKTGKINLDSSTNEINYQSQQNTKSFENHNVTREEKTRNNKIDVNNELTKETKYEETTTADSMHSNLLTTCELNDDTEEDSNQSKNITKIDISCKGNEIEREDGIAKTEINFNGQVAIDLISLENNMRNVERDTDISFNKTEEIVKVDYNENVKNASVDSKEIDSEDSVIESNGNSTDSKQDMEFNT